MSGHTPGPWATNGNRNVTSPSGHLVVHVPRGAGAGATERAHADARLIAAAPTLLAENAELRALVEAIDPTFEPQDPVEQWAGYRRLREAARAWLAAHPQQPKEG